MKIRFIHPSSWIRVGKRTRRAIIKRFLYIILYIHESDTICVTCIAHQHRKPEYYVDRLEQ